MAKKKTGFTQFIIIEMPEHTETKEERYRIFIEDIADGFYETDLRGNFKLCNKVLCQIFGYPEAGIRDNNFRKFMDEKNAGIAFAQFNKIYRTGRGETDIVWEILRKNGEKRILEVSANLITDDNGQKLGFRGIARDITEKYIEQQNLRASEQRTLSQYRASRHAEIRYRTLLDFLPDPVVVFNLDSTTSYLNPAFVKTFGWTLEELKGKRIPFVPDFLKAEIRQGIRLLFKEKVVHGVETQRLTKDGRLLDILLNVAVFYGVENEPAGHVAIFRDVTDEKRVSRSNQALFRIAKALPSFLILDEILEFIIKEVQNLIDAEGASVILLDEEKKEFFFRMANYDNTETGKNLKEIRFPADKGVAGYVYRTGHPLIVTDTSLCPYFFQEVDEQSGYKTQNMLDVPIRTRNRMIGVLCAVNKRKGEFDLTDAELLSAIASTVALPIENTWIHEELNRSYQEVRSLNRAKERVIHHLSHELKTPISVLDASLKLLSRKISESEDTHWERILNRGQRNLDRILEMQYEIEDILKEKNYRTYHLLSTLLDVCEDEVEALFEAEIRDSEPGIRDSSFQKIIQGVRERMDGLFSPKESVSREIRPDRFIEENIQALYSRFGHRNCCLETHFSTTSPILIPPDVLAKIVEGLIRNAVENTPDEGQIEVTVRSGKNGPEFEVRDFGIGITADNQSLIFEGIFTTRETMQYSSRAPYDFNAGGKGIDLLRMKIFSERYHFTIRMTSERCGFIPRDQDICPGTIEGCDHCRSVKDCFRSGGTAMIVSFSPYNGEQS
ncbi:PAS domain S-box protein [Desulfococcaceae bacterium HSG8]|nr:PAS domain S-box protein [Desulfococcaceae bacterium HSG8]